MKNFFITAGFAVFFVSCQTVPYQGKAREVKRKPSDGGVIALDVDHRAEDRQRADEKMKSNCGELSVKILEEGEVVVGQTTNSTTSEDQRNDTRRKAGNFLGMALVTGQAAGTDSQTSSTTTQLKEWQISYECSSKKKAVH
jgi:hypothetical protein